MRLRRKRCPIQIPEYKAQFAAKVKVPQRQSGQRGSYFALHASGRAAARAAAADRSRLPKQLVFLYADLTGNHWRVIPVDGHHSSDPEDEATYNGDSVAHWDGDTLVVDVTRLTDDTWLADNGFLHTNKLHVTERLRRVGDTIQYSMTADDPVVLDETVDHLPYADPSAGYSGRSRLRASITTPAITSTRSTTTTRASVLSCKFIEEFVMWGGRPRRGRRPRRPLVSRVMVGPDQGVRPTASWLRTLADYNEDG